MRTVGGKGAPLDGHVKQGSFFALPVFRRAGRHLLIAIEGDPDLCEVDRLEGRRRRTTWKTDSRAVRRGR